MLERLGFVRIRDFGLILTPDRRLVTTDGDVVGWPTTDPEPAAEEIFALGSSSSLPTAVPEPVPEIHTEPIDERAIEDIAHAEDVEHGVADESDDEPDEDEWEWEIAVARARASSESLPVRRSAPTEPPPVQAVLPARSAPTTSPPPVQAEPPPIDPSRPRTVIPVPTLPSGAVRSYEPPRFPRATNRGMPVASPRASVRR